MLVGYVMLLLAVLALLPWGHDFPSVQIPSEFFNLLLKLSLKFNFVNTN